VSTKRSGVAKPFGTPRALAMWWATIVMPQQVVSSIAENLVFLSAATSRRYSNPRRSPFTDLDPRTERISRSRSFAGS
jgi:hypothetical protein